MVHATVRDPDDVKNAHLKTLENAAENLQLFKAELLGYDSLFAANKECVGVFHVASPILQDNVSNPEKEIVELAGIFFNVSPKRGRLFVSASSGSIGNIVGQLAQLFGCFVVGCFETKEKVWLDNMQVLVGRFYSVNITK